MLIDLTWHIHGFLSSSAKSVEAKVCVVVLCATYVCIYSRMDGGHSCQGSSKFGELPSLD